MGSLKIKLAPREPGWSVRKSGPKAPLNARVPKVISFEEFVPSPIFNKCVIDVAVAEMKINHELVPGRKAGMLEELIKRIDESDMEPRSKAAIRDHYIILLERVKLTLPDLDDEVAKEQALARLKKTN